MKINKPEPESIVLAVILSLLLVSIGLGVWMLVAIIHLIEAFAHYIGG